MSSKVTEIEVPPQKDLKYTIYMPNDYGPLRMMLTKLGHSIIYSLEGGKYYDMALFTPGPDIHPYLYGEDVTSWCDFNMARDKRDNQAYRKLASDLPKVGVGRGAQFLHVMNGGRLYQHVTNHLNKPHNAFDTTTQEEFIVSSHHHQMMRVDQELSPAYIMLTAEEAADRFVPNEHIHKAGFEEPDIEALYYYDTNSFCFQPHPDDFHPQHPCPTWFFTTIYQMYGKDIMKRRAEYQKRKK